MDNIDVTDICYFISLAILVFVIFGIIYYLFFNREQTNSQNFEGRHKNKVENFRTKIQVLENKVNNLIENEPLDIPNVDKEKELFEMYYKGIPDTYDIRGRLIKGVEPDALKAINYIQIIIKSPYGTEKDKLSLAKIYHYGMHKFERNLDKAEDIYNGLKFENISAETRALLKEALADIQKIRVYTWLNLPLERPIIHNENTEQVLVIPVEAHTPIRHPVIIQPIVNLPNFPRRQQEIKLDQKGYNDPQNTHNPQVLSTIRHSLNNLKNKTNVVKSPGVSATEIKNYIHTLLDSDKKTDAIKSLYAIESNPDKLSSTDMTEMDALTLVWNRINDTNKFNKEVIDNLKETLYDELASMQEFGVTICSTGRFTHIIDTLNGVDDDVSIKPTYAINEEMLSKASHIREKMYQEHIVTTYYPTKSHPLSSPFQIY